MIVLACESSTLLGSVAVVKDGITVATEESMRQGSHSDLLNVLIERALKQSDLSLKDIDLFVSSTGPGSFTGIRISLNAIKTLAYCHQKPVCGGSSLLSLAAATKNSKYFNQFKNKPIISMINAYKNMCYVASYLWQEQGLVESSPPQVLRVQNLTTFLTQDAVICGDGFSTYQKFFPQSLADKMLRFADVSDEPRAETLALLASDSKLNTMPWNQLLPLYLRSSEAEENLQGIKYEPLI